MVKTYSCDGRVVEDSEGDYVTLKDYNDLKDFVLQIKDAIHYTQLEERLEKAVQTTTSSD